MAYTTTAIVRAESPFKNSTKIADAVVQRAIDEMANFIDGKIGQIYTLPLASTPTALQGVNTTLAIYELLRDENLNIEIAQGVNIQQMVEDQLGILQEIVDRKQTLIDSTGAEYAIKDTLKVSGLPTDATTESTGDDNTPRLFTMDQEF